MTTATTNGTRLASDLRINSVEFTNFRCLEHYEESFDGKSVQIKGPNHLGKSSVLIAIEWGLGAIDERDVPAMIRHGAKQATGKVTVGNGKPEYVITRTKTAKGQKLEITAADGLRQA